MYDKLTENDIKKMQEEIDYRKLVVRPKELEAVKEARAQGGDDRDGDEAPQRMGDGAHGVFKEGASHCVVPVRRTGLSPAPIALFNLFNALSLSLFRPG